MAQVFIAYDRRDADLAERVVVGLRSVGFEVWWDQDMLLGVDWVDELQRRLKELAALVAIWTPASAENRSVMRDELRVTRDGALINTLCGVDRPPFPYERVPGIALDGWTGGMPHAGWTALVTAVETRVVNAGGGQAGQFIKRLKAIERQTTWELPDRTSGLEDGPELGPAALTQAVAPLGSPRSGEEGKAKHTASPRILISYRRDDSEAATGRIRDQLAIRFGEDAVYIDIDNIPIGADFRVHVAQAVRNADVVLAIIGARWRGFRRKGAYRISDANDPVRLEIEAALQAKVPIVPILIDGLPMPTAESLPDSIRDLSFRNGLPIDNGRDFHVHMNRLFRSIEALAKNPSQAYRDEAAAS